MGRCHLPDHTRRTSRGGPDTFLIVSLVGLKKTGKTTTAEALVREFVSRGMKVGALKAMPHGTFTIDPSGKDTARVREAGAHVVVAVSDAEVAIIERRRDRPALCRILAMIPPVDVLVCEGLEDDPDCALTVLIASSPSDLEETARVRGRRRNVVAVAGMVANDHDGSTLMGLPVVNAAVPDGAVRLVDLLLARAGMASTVAPGPAGGRRPGTHGDDLPEKV